jgi:hypothetical protein
MKVTIDVPEEFSDGLHIKISRFLDRVVTDMKNYVDKLYDIVNVQIKENNIHPNFKHLIYSKMRHGKTSLTPY